MTPPAKTKLPTHSLCELILNVIPDRVDCVTDLLLASTKLFTSHFPEPGTLYGKTNFGGIMKLRVNSYAFKIRFPRYMPVCVYKYAS